MKRIFLVCFMIYFFAVPVFSQRFKYLKDTTYKNFYEMRVAMEEDWIREHGSGFSLEKELKNSFKPGQEEENEYLHFKRWEEYVSPRVYPSGDLSLLSWNFFNFNKYEDSIRKKIISQSPNAKTAAATWSFVGPPGTNTQGRNGGRMNVIRFDPTNTNIIYAGAPAGGVWKTTNGGTSWLPMSDYLISIGCSDIGISAANPSILYLASGDNDAGDTQSLGILKSTDGGSSWSTTGLSWTPNQFRQISRVLVHPTDPNIVMCFGSQGCYRSINGGTTWTQSLTGVGYIKDAELKPDDPNIVYAVSDRLYRSTNGGVSFTVVNGGLPTTDIGRVSMAVTPGNANYVYILMCLANGDYKGMYRSSDAGLNFVLQSSTPNILGYNTTFGSGNQSYYDMCMAANTVNPELIFANGVRNFRSTDGGVTWQVATVDCLNAALEMHWDIHYVEFVPGSATNAFAANDGGVYKTTNTGTCWTAVNQNNIAVNQIYRFGMATDNPEVMISGHQDGATLCHRNAVYLNVIGGDGFDCFIDRTNNATMYGELYFGGFCRSTDAGVNWTWLADNPGIVGLDGGWNTPWYQDPIEANSIWCGYDQIYKSMNQGNTWTQMGTIAGTGKMIDLRVAPSNNQVVYAARYNELYRTTNNGGTWTNITAGLPIALAAITRIAVSETDPNRAWITFSGYSAANKVYTTMNGGVTWTNISAGLPNLPVNCIQYVPASTSNEIYIGADVGVYYRNTVDNTWVPYYTGLPHAPVSDIEVYAATKHLRVSTYGRGIWKVDYYDPTALNFQSNSDGSQDLSKGNNTITDQNISIYPNPFTGQTLMVIVPGSIYSVRLLDMKGEEVQKPSFEPTGLVKLNELASGNYMLEVTINEGYKWVRKIIKK